LAIPNISANQKVQLQSTFLPDGAISTNFAIFLAVVEMTTFSMRQSQSCFVYFAGQSKLLM